MTTDITNVQMAYMMTLRLMSRAPIMIVLSWIMTSRINMDIALMILAAIPILGFALIFIAKKAHKYFIKVFDEYDVLNNDVQENVNAARVVKAYVREDHEISKFHKISLKVFDLFTKAEKIVAFNSPVMMFVMYAALIGMVLIARLGEHMGLTQAGTAEQIAYTFLFLATDMSLYATGGSFVVDGGRCS